MEVLGDIARDLFPVFNKIYHFLTTIPLSRHAHPFPLNDRLKERNHSYLIKKSPVR
jgi:hypothetical protein